MFKHYDISMPYREEATPDGTPADNAEPKETPPEDIVEDQADLWGDLTKQLDSDDLEEDDSPEPEPVEDPVETPEPVEEPEPVEPTPPAEPEIEQLPTPPEPTPEKEEPKEEKPTVSVDEQKAQLVQALEQQFQLDEDTKIQLITDPGTALPKILAKQQADMYHLMMESIRQQLPQAIEYNTQSIAERSEKQDAFFKAWPKLNKKDHGAAIAQTAKLYQELNRDATDEDIIRDIGMQVMFKYNLQADLQESAQEPTPQQDPPPRRVLGRNIVRSDSGPSNPWAAMADELLEDDI